MNLQEFERKFKKLGSNYRTKDIDKLNKELIKQNIDVSFLKPIIKEHEEYYRTYFQVTIIQKSNIEDKMKFIEENFDLLRDWWHVDGIVSFLGNSIDFKHALEKAKQYTKSELPYVRRLGYVIFIPRLVKNRDNIDELFRLLKNDNEYHVVMGEAWLISYLAMCDSDKTYNYLKDCDLNYNIVGKAIQKICDSFVISENDKIKYKKLRESRKQYK